MMIILIGCLIATCKVVDREVRKEDLMEAMSTWDKWEREEHRAECKKYGIELAA